MPRRLVVLTAAVLTAATLLRAHPATARNLQSVADKTIWDGIYNAAQARRGAAIYNTECSYCHKDDLSGGFFDGGAGSAPALAGPRAFGSSFAERWNQASVGEMLATIASSMPQPKPAS